VSYPYVLVVNPGVAATGVAELAALAKREPAKINAVSLGQGGVTHLLNERFEALAGVTITDIHYRGAAPALIDLIAGQVQMYFDSVTTSMVHIRSGKLRPLAVSTEERSALLPDVPTFREVGFPAMTQRGWFGVFAPAATPRTVVERLHGEVLAATASDEARSRFQLDGLTRMAMSPAEFDAFIKADLAPWARTLKELNIRIE
jgi:tripartite-type tricarboxylate transporter receptor subunit TctC